MSDDSRPTEGQIPVSLPDMYQIVGEREVVRVMLQRQVEAQQREIAALRAQLATVAPKP